jgi:hypothetical protein
VSVNPAVSVAIQDAYGNTVTSTTALISVAIGTNPGGGTLSGTTSVSASGGVASFGTLSINKAGTGYTLRASSAGLIGATSSAFNVTAGPAYQLAFTVQPPGTAAAGSPLSPAVQVTIQDKQGNTVTTSTASVTVVLGGPSGGTLYGTTSVTATSGVATFRDLSIHKPGTAYTLTATSGTLASATSSAFNITAGAPAQLVFTVQPSDTRHNQTIQPAVQVTVQDAFGNTVTSSSDLIFMDVVFDAKNNGSLSGDQWVSARNGVATFTNLTLNPPGTGYRLSASSGTLQSATSDPFDISPN